MTQKNENKVNDFFLLIHKFNKAVYFFSNKPSKQRLFCPLLFADELYTVPEREKFCRKKKRKSGKITLS